MLVVDDSLTVRRVTERMLLHAGPMLDEVRYLSDPFTGTDLGDIQASGLRGDWTRLCARGRCSAPGMP